MNETDQIVAELRIMDMNNVKPNYAAMGRKYNKDWRTIKRYHLGYKGKPRNRNKPSSLDKYKDEIRNKLSIKRTKIRGAYEFMINTYGLDEIGESEHMQSIVNGTMPPEKFKFQIMQNYQYLMDYLRTWSTALAKCNDYEEMSDLLVIINDIYAGINHHRNYWGSYIGATPEEMDATIEAEGKRSYTAFQSMIAHTGTLAELVCAVFPCGIMYTYFGEDLLPKCHLPENNVFYQWIAYYATDKYKQEAANKEAMINKYCAHKTEREIAKLLEITADACNYEILQWTNLYHNMATWPLDDIFPKKFTTIKE